MSKENDGGPAFPRTGFRTEYGPEPFDAKPQDGMTLRDWLAGQAMPALMMNANAVFVAAAKADSPEALRLAKLAYSETAIAAGAYALADAMLEARNKDFCRSLIDVLKANPNGLWDELVEGGFITK